MRTHSCGSALSSDGRHTLVLMRTVFTAKDMKMDAPVVLPAKISIAEHGTREAASVASKGPQSKACFNRCTCVSVQLQKNFET